MPQNTKKPQLRFKGFTDDWEQRKLGEVVDITSGFMGNALLSSGQYRITRIETIADGLVDETRIGYSDKKPDDIFLLKKGDILYSNINSISHIGKVAQYHGLSNLYHGINLLRLSPKDNIVSDFLVQILNTKSKRNWAKAHANQAVSQASINQSLLASQEISICSLKEQKKIGYWFTYLNNLIALQQRKLDKLKNVKKSMLEKMFPKNGSIVPEIRFKGFIDDWEQRKLGDLCSEIGDGLHSAPIYDEKGSYFFINGNNLVNGKIIIDENETKKVSQNIFNDNNKNLDNTTLLLSINGTIGNLAYYQGEQVMLGKSAAYLKCKFVDKTYLYGVLQTNLILKSFMASLTGTTIKNLGLEVIKNTYIFSPKVNEQVKIGKYFHNLDNLITLHQRKLEKLQNIKKACLEKMFV